MQGIKLIVSKIPVFQKKIGSKIHSKSKLQFNTVSNLFSTIPLFYVHHFFNFYAIIFFKSVFSVFLFKFVQLFSWLFRFFCLIYNEL